MYYTAVRRHCTMGLSPLNICIREIWPFAPIFQGNNCFRVKYLKITFTFNIYLGTSWKEAKSAKKSIEILTGWWKVVFQIFGMSWMLSGFVIYMVLSILCYDNVRGELEVFSKYFLWCQIVQVQSVQMSIVVAKIFHCVFQFFLHYVVKLFGRCSSFV